MNSVFIPHGRPPKGLTSKYLGGPSSSADLEQNYRVKDFRFIWNSTISNV